MDPQKLLKSLATRVDPLSDAEVTAIVEHHELNPTLNPKHVPPHPSKDFQVGTKRQSPATMAADSSTDTIVNQLDRENTAVEHFDPELQRAAFQFIKSDVRIELQSKFIMPWIKIPGIQRSFYAFQVYGAFYMLSQERGVRRGLVLADLMGLGKTTTVFLYILLNHFLVENARHIREHPDLHCDPRGSAAASAGGRQCPSQALFPIACACSQQSITSQLKLVERPGASLLFAPASLLGNWIAEWEKFGVDPEHKIKLYVAHAGFKHLRVPANQLRHLHLRDERDDERDDDGDDNGDEDDDGGQPPVELTAPHTANRFIVLTTPESYGTQVRMAFGNIKRLGGGDYTDGVAWARVARDEAHLTSNWATEIYRIMKSLVRDGFVPPNFVAITASPMLRRGLVDILACVKAINMVSPGISSSPDYKRFAKSGALDKLGQAFVRFREKQRLGGDVDDDEIRKQAAHVGAVLAAYCLRRRSDSIQNGKILVQIPPLESYDVLCPTPNGYRQLAKYVEHFLRASEKGCLGIYSDAKDTVSVKDMLDLCSKTRLLSTLPHATSLSDKSETNWKTICDNQWHTYPELSPIWKSLDRWVESSGKLQMLKEILSKLDTDPDGAPEPLVVCSEFNFVCLAVLCLVRKSGLSAEWMHTDTKMPERRELVAAFQAEAGTTPFQVLIGTTTLMGAGLTLHRACRMVLMEPSLHATVEDQVGDRVHRIGSRSDRCWLYRLINPDSEKEAQLVKDQLNQVKNNYWAEYGPGGDLEDDDKDKDQDSDEKLYDRELQSFLQLGNGQDDPVLDYVSDTESVGSEDEGIE
ncbi:hypothetical protein HRR83_000360 [Exophiala dermatitidis]|uniref:Helicase C-terminal domain-containing protein n=1 Tax=Exophiala dermatitidis TaxID=5970 RepID=A0AAN6F3A4_EXODE|nr:hypothetical protein HRR73_002896 [Exophiala dermatitidis]KAJ4524735.1 hypothetical protein HRR75_000325 [Exophiala dermatitidis]KAJ4527608.1 hypothetical protein HRR74_000362 [Exophiala dermatitidis]KAJ4531184.1 hypothetical protein HRR76_008858 [Exophiala dermatitidis]KAJ4536191.1 hypothetical protein HRR78_008630 [Exophiala dermatitidis]